MLDTPQNKQNQIDEFYDVLVSEENDYKGVNHIEAELVDQYQPVATAQTLREFIQAYQQKNFNQSHLDWLIQQFEKHSSLWNDEVDLKKDAQEIVQTIENYYQSKQELEESYQQGYDDADWLAKKIEEGASINGFNQVGDYAQHIDQAIQSSNQRNAELIYCKNGILNQQYNLDGFIAEHHHTNTFNLDAAAKGSEYRAEVLVPTDGGYGKNSVDIVIRDGNGKIVRRYQAKYGSDGKVTENLFQKGDYRGQRKLVPEGQDVENSTDKIEIDGIESKPLSKEEAKEFQRKAQIEAESKQYDWNDVNKKVIARNIGKSALIASSVAVGFQGARIVGRRIWNSLTGKANKSFEEDLQEFVTSSLESGANAGFTVAVTGGVTVAVKSGFLGNALKSTPVGRIASAVTVGIENIKIFNRYAKGAISAHEALDQAGQVTTCTIGSIAAGAKGASIGATLGSVLGPIGTVIGGVAGGAIGAMAGGVVAEKLYIAAKSIARETVDTVKSVARSVGRTISNTASRAFSALTSWW